MGWSTRRAIPGTSTLKFEMKASKRALHGLTSLATVALVTAIDYRIAHVNATTAGFTYLVAVLLISAFLGTVDAVVASLFAVACFNFFFLPPILTFTIADPQNWVALFAFLTTALVASRLAGWAREQTHQAQSRHQEMELLYALSRSILLAQPGEPIAKLITFDLARIFDFTAVVLLDARTGQTFIAGPGEPPANAEALRQQLHESSLNGTSFADEVTGMRIFAVRLGGQPIGSLAVRPARGDPSTRRSTSPTSQAPCQSSPT